MKQLIFLIALFSFNNAISQSEGSQIEKLEISYKQADLLVVTSADSIKYTPQITIHLKTGSGVSKLYFKMIDESSNVVLYDVNYLLSSIPVLDQTGKKVFYKDEQGIYYIMPVIQIPLKTYLFQLFTEDNLSNQSLTLTETH